MTLQVKDIAKPSNPVPVSFPDLPTQLLSLAICTVTEAGMEAWEWG